MLIRSQDKGMIVNFDNICTVSAFPEEDSEDIYAEDGTGSLMVGRYSTKEKTMKVLDMIQEAYAEYEMLLQTFMGIASVRVTTTEKEILDKKKKDIKKKAIFQMPQDSEVEE